MAWAFVQLHAYDLHDWSEFRNAQVQATKKLPGVVMAAAIDLGDPTSPWDPIHPRYKQEVGRRLAQAVIGARYAQYGGVHYSGPKFVDAYPVRSFLLIILCAIRLTGSCFCNSWPSRRRRTTASRDTG